MEICASVQAVKYINKYIYKGNDRTALHVESELNEVTAYLQSRCIGPSEAIWRIFEYQIHEEQPAVIHLKLHLPNKQLITFCDDETPEELQDRLQSSFTTLTAVLKYNDDYSDGHNYLYHEFPLHYVFDTKYGKWHPRKTLTQSIGRVYFCSPAAGERYFLRLLLMAVRDPTSFQHIRTVDGIVHPTFNAACVALRLVEDDRDCVECLADASTFATGSQLRSLLSLACVYGVVNDPLRLWERFKANICDDLRHNLEHTAWVYQT